MNDDIDLGAIEWDILDRDTATEQMTNDFGRVAESHWHPNLPFLGESFDFSECKPLDLTTKQLPLYVGALFSRAEEISRTLIEGYASDDIRMIIDDIHQYYVRDVASETGESLTVLETVLTLDHFTEIHKVLETYMHQGIDPSKLSTFQAISWPLIYSAVCRLAIEEAIHTQERIDLLVDDEDFITKYRYVSYHTRHLIQQATACAHIASILTVGNPVFTHYSQAVKDNNKQVAKKGGQARSAKYDPIKKALYQILETTHFEGKSRPQMARMILKTFPQNLLVDENNEPLVKDVEAFFLVWIARYFRSKSPKK